jgi:hypothetical protein
MAASPAGNETLTGTPDPRADPPRHGEDLAALAPDGDRDPGEGLGGGEDDAALVQVHRVLGQGESGGAGHHHGDLEDLGLLQRPGPDLQFRGEAPGRRRQGISRSPHAQVALRMVLPFPSATVTRTVTS